MVKHIIIFLLAWSLQFSTSCLQSQVSYATLKSTITNSTEKKVFNYFKLEEAIRDSFKHRILEVENQINKIAFDSVWNKIESLEKKMIDSIASLKKFKERAYIKKYIQKSGFGIYSPELAEIFFRNNLYDSRFQFVESTGFQINPTTNNSTLNSSVYTDMLSSFKVEAQFSLGDQASIQYDSLIIERLFSGAGGNFSIDFFYPIYHRVSDGFSKSIRIMMLSSTSMDIPALNFQLDETNINTLVGINLNGYVTGQANKLTLFFNIDYGYFTGNEPFRNMTGNKNISRFFNYQVGVSFADHFQLSYKKNYNEGMFEPEYIGVAFTQNLEKEKD